MHSRLPIAVPPAHHETAGSYVQRLATRHGLPLPELWEQVSHPRRPGSTSRLVALDRLAAVTGHPASRLARAVIDQVGQVWWPVEQWIGRPDPQLVAGADVVVLGQQLQPDAAAVAGGAAGAAGLRGVPVGQPVGFGTT
jgi:hypothetical protein